MDAKYTAPPDGLSPQQIGLQTYRTQMRILDDPVPATCRPMPHFANRSDLNSWRGNTDFWDFGYDYDSDGAALFNIAPAGTRGVVIADGGTSLSNNQVAGVDEADFMKTDGETLYLIQGSELVVVAINPATGAFVRERIPIDGSPLALLLDPVHLAVVTLQSSQVVVLVYDRTSHPLALRHSISLSGMFGSARAIGDHLFLTASFGLYGWGSDFPLPELSFDGVATALSPEDVGYLASSRGAQSLLMVLKVNMSAESAPSLTTLLADPGWLMYASEANLYLAGPGQAAWTDLEGTRIYKFPLRRGEEECVVSGEVPGRILNPFSMDEFNGNLRVATTIGHTAKVGATAENLVCVLSPDLRVVGALDDLAPGEQIHSARFLGDRLYLVTFKKVDPLFVIDLADPAKPSVLGYLKIPGFSDYLHPIAPGLLVGVGMETAESPDGSFAWFQGVKLSLFDVRDARHPKELANLVVGERGTSTPVTDDHLAFTWVPERSELILPIRLFEVNTSSGREVTPSTFGEETRRGAFEIKVTEERGFEIERLIEHQGSEPIPACRGVRFGSGAAPITRSFVVEPYLYTVSATRVEAHSMDDGTAVFSINLDPDTDTNFLLSRCSTWGGATWGD